MNRGRPAVWILAAFALTAAVAFWQAAQPGVGHGPRTLKAFMKELSAGLRRLKEAAESGMGPEGALAAQDLAAAVARIPDFAPSAMRESVLFMDFVGEAGRALEAYSAYANGSPDAAGLAARYQSVRQACSKCHASFNRGKPF